MGPNSVRSSGSGSRAVSINGRQMFACGAGPLVAITDIGSGGVTVQLDGQEVQIAAGSSGTLGPYQITLISVDGGTATLETNGPG